MDTLWQDFQFAVRMMRKNLGFTTAAVLCLMLGLAADRDCRHIARDSDRTV
jgi:hypothetical protein